MKYIAYYDSSENKKENRYYVLSATNKIDYICHVLQTIGESVEIISASATQGKSCCKGKKVAIKNKNILKLFFSLGRGNKIKNVFGRLMIKTEMFFYLKKNLKKGDKVIVYHSLGYTGLISMLKKVKKFYLIMEIEEIYSDVSGNIKGKKREMKFFEQADAYIFPTTLLNEKINETGKPHVIIHGTYEVEKDRNEKFDDDKIHVVYAGTFDPRKGGVLAAISAAEYLPEDYHIHILGFGNGEQIEEVKKVIENVNEKSCAMLSYDGLLSGEEYIQFIQKCDIGLSTQNPDAEFNATSFPSKILSYMANGLRVVSIRIPAIETSAVGNDMYYYDKQTAQEIAKAIMSVDLADNYDGREKIKRLDKAFRHDLKKLI